MRLLTNNENLELALNGYPILSDRWMGIGFIKRVDPYAFTIPFEEMYITEFPGVMGAIVESDIAEQSLRLATRREVADCISSVLELDDDKSYALERIINNNNVASIKEKVEFIPDTLIPRFHEMLDLCKLVLDVQTDLKDVREMMLSGYPVVSSKGYVGCFEQVALNKMFAKPAMFGDWRFTDYVGTTIKGDAEYLLKSVNPRLATIDDAGALFDYAISCVYFELSVKLDLKDPDAKSQITHLIEEYPDYRLRETLVNMVGILEVTEKIKSGELPAGRLFGELND